MSLRVYPQQTLISWSRNPTLLSKTFRRYSHDIIALTTVESTSFQELLCLWVEQVAMERYIADKPVWSALPPPLRMWGSFLFRRSILYWLLSSEQHHFQEQVPVTPPWCGISSSPQGSVLFWVEPSQCLPSGSDTSRWWVEDSILHAIGPLWVYGHAFWSYQCPSYVPVSG